MDARKQKLLGKWSEAGVPHKGWTCIDVEDLGKHTDICEMCERATIRFAHVMEHPDFPHPLRCGCDCAGRMEQDYEAAKQREHTVRKASRQRQRQEKRVLDPSKWSVSRHDNRYLNIGDYNFVMMGEPHSGYRLGVVKRDEGTCRQWSRIYDDEQQAAAAALEWCWAHDVLERPGGSRKRGDDEPG